MAMSNNSWWVGESGILHVVGSNLPQMRVVYLKPMVAGNISNPVGHSLDRHNKIYQESELVYCAATVAWRKEDEYGLSGENYGIRLLEYKGLLSVVRRDFSLGE